MFQKLIQGDSLNFATTVPAYPPSAGWTLYYRLVPRSAGNAVINLQAVVDGTSYRVLQTASQTALWAPDTYTWSSWVDKAGETYTVASGQITVVANPRLAQPGYDDRTQEEIDLEAVLAAIRARMTGGAVAEYAIRDRSLKYMAITELHAERNRLAVIVARQRRAKAITAGLGKAGRTGVRFA
jgi:hypothetical protein